MRLIQFLVQDELSDEKLSVLDGLGVDYVILRADRRNASLVLFPAPTGAVEEILDELRDANLEIDNYTVISELNSATTPNIDELEKHYTEGPDAASYVSYDELRTSAREITPDQKTFIAEAVLSAAVAAAGLLLNSAILIVGAMVISPFTSSVLSVALGAIIGDRDLMRDGTTSQLFGLIIAVLTATGVGLLTKWSTLAPPNHAISGVDQIREFSSPNLLLILIAIAAGSAGAFALATDQRTALVGVAVAAAIVPSAATIGVGLAWKIPSIAVGAFTLLVANVLLINAVSYVTFVLIGYQSPVFEKIR